MHRITLQSDIISFRVALADITCSNLSFFVTGLYPEDRHFIFFASGDKVSDCGALIKVKGIKSYFIIFNLDLSSLLWEFSGSVCTLILASRI